MIAHVLCAAIEWVEDHRVCGEMFTTAITVMELLVVFEMFINVRMSVCACMCMCMRVRVRVCVCVCVCVCMDGYTSYTTVNCAHVVSGCIFYFKMFFEFMENFLLTNARYSSLPMNICMYMCVCTCRCLRVYHRDCLQSVSPRKLGRVWQCFLCQEVESVRKLY